MPLALAATSCTSITTSEDGGFQRGELAVEWATYATGLEAPVYAVSPPGDPRLFVVEQPGRIRVIRDGNLNAEPFLDLTSRVRFGGEQGLLGLAFDPDFRASGRFWVHYTGLDGSTRVEGYRDIDRSDRADPSSGRIYLEVEQPFSNHNGGQIEFGPDAMLYIGLGDGGAAGDPMGHGQNLGTLLGSILRIDVLGSLEPPYAVPPDNPFVGVAGARPEIWHYGLRNPWRFSFDTNGSGRMYVGDVGQERWEEINVATLAAGGLNFGWNVMEGSECFGDATCEGEGLTFPTVVYGHGDGCSVTGGYVYRGLTIPELLGRYVFSDFCSGWLRSFRLEAGGPRDPLELISESPGSITSLGEDSRGEIYATVSDGRVLLLVPSG